MRTAKYVIDRARDVLVTGTILHLRCDAAVCDEAGQARDDGKIRVFLPSAPIRPISWLLAVRTFGEVRVRPYVAETRVWTAVVLFGLETRQKGNAGAQSVECWQWGFAWEHKWEFPKVVIACMGLDFVRKSATDGEVIVTESTG
jgi:hypothetical protein